MAVGVIQVIAKVFDILLFITPISFSKCNEDNYVLRFYLHQTNVLSIVASLPILCQQTEQFNNLATPPQLQHGLKISFPILSLVYFAEKETTQSFKL